ncbi:MAG: type I methionyl aminopeptidase [Planctomycetota bacterium]
MLQRQPKFTPKSLTDRDIAGLRDAARAVVTMHEELSGFLKIGMKLPEIDAFVAETLRKLNCKSCFHHYKVPGAPPFPSYACLSVNECVVHGTAAYYREPMRAGDVLKIDIGTKKAGWIGDAAWTYVFGEPSDEVRSLTDCGKETLARGVRELVPGKKLMDWARVVQRYVENDCGFKMIKGLGGHGYGRQLHGPPYVSNVEPQHPAEWPDQAQQLLPNMAIAVEPMIAVSSNQVAQHPSGWPLMVIDGSQSVHYEHDVLVTEEGNEILTAGLENIEDVISR